MPFSPASWVPLALASRKTVPLTVDSVSAAEHVRSVADNVTATQPKATMIVLVLIWSMAT